MKVINIALSAVATERAMKSKSSYKLLVLNNFEDLWPMRYCGGRLFRMVVAQIVKEGAETSYG